MTHSHPSGGGAHSILSSLPLEANPGYHQRAIPRGEVGELSKVLEEALEALEAEAQGAAVMVLVELSDLVGAIKAYLARHHSTLTLEDLERFAAITARAFESGNRPQKPQEGVL